MHTTQLSSEKSRRVFPPMAACAPVTPSRRANVPAHVKAYVLGRAASFGYHDSAHTKEEKQAFISALSKELNERYGAETGAWDEARTGTYVRNLRHAGARGKENNAAAEEQAPRTLTATSSPVQRLLRDWQNTLLAASLLNSTTLARHTSNKGTCNEELVRGFLASVLGSRMIGIGSGEILARSTSDPPPRQLDVVLYDTAYPVLRPASLCAAAAANTTCFYPESVLAVVEVKTTLTNQDLRDVGLAAQRLGTVPLYVFAFDSQVTLKSIDLSCLPENVLGVYTLSHGCAVHCSEGWCVVLPSRTQPLEQFYSDLLDMLGLEESLQRVVTVLKDHLAAAATAAGSEDDVSSLDLALQSMTVMERAKT